MVVPKIIEKATKVEAADESHAFVDWIRVRIQGISSQAGSELEDRYL